MENSETELPSKVRASAERLWISFSGTTESSFRFLASTALLANCTTGVISLIKFFLNDWNEHSRLFVLSSKSFRPGFVLCFFIIIIILIVIFVFDCQVPRVNRMRANCMGNWPSLASSSFVKTSIAMVGLMLTYKSRRFLNVHRWVLRKVGKFDRHGLEGFKVIQLISEGEVGHYCLNPNVWSHCIILFQAFSPFFNTFI